MCVFKYLEVKRKTKVEVIDRFRSFDLKFNTHSDQCFARELVYNKKKSHLTFFLYILRFDVEELIFSLIG